MPEETAAEMAIPDESEAAPAEELAEGGSQATGAGIGASAGKGRSADAAVVEFQPDGASPNERGDIPGENRQPEQVAAPASPGALSRAAAGALRAAAEQISRDGIANAGDEAALAQALRTFLDAFAGQNAPTRSEFRDLAARLDRLSSQFQKGR
jgi:hypothetical protein